MVCILIKSNAHIYAYCMYIEEIVWISSVFLFIVISYFSITMTKVAY